MDPPSPKKKRIKLEIPTTTGWNPSTMTTMPPHNTKPSLKQMEFALEMRPAVKRSCIEDLDSPDEYPAFIQKLYDDLVVPGYWVPGDLNATYSNASHLFICGGSDSDSDDDE